MKNRTIIIILMFSFFSFGCKKEYVYDVKYKVIIVPLTGQSISTEVDYYAADMVQKKETITTTQWEYSFKGKEGDTGWLKAVNLSNASSIQIEMTISGASYIDECNTNNCSVILSKPFN